MSWWKHCAFYWVYDKLNAKFEKFYNNKNKKILGTFFFWSWNFATWQKHFKKWRKNELWFLWNLDFFEIKLIKLTTSRPKHFLGHHLQEHFIKMLPPSQKHQKKFPKCIWKLPYSYEQSLLKGRKRLMLTKQKSFVWMRCLWS
jgi:hypothetical protein